jgi:hypothetical protein
MTEREVCIVVLRYKSAFVLWCCVISRRLYCGAALSVGVCIVVLRYQSAFVLWCCVISRRLYCGAALSVGVGQY